MSRKWTAPQLDAINIRNKTVLVSAAAGSGKTATLTERIIKRITSDSSVDISKMLVVTYTRAAAAELRVRIFDALNKEFAKNPLNKHLASQLMKVGNAHICTIDSFYFDVLKANMASAKLKAPLRIADAGEYAILSYRVMESAIDKLYETEPDFYLLTECFGNAKEMKKLTDKLLKIYDHKLTQIPEGIEFLNKCAKSLEEDAGKDFLSSSYGEIIVEKLQDIIDHYEPIFKAAKPLCELDEELYEKRGSVFQGCLELMDNIRTALNGADSYSAIRLLLSTFSVGGFTRLSSKVSDEGLEEYKGQKKPFVDDIEELASSFFAKSPEFISLTMLDTAKRISLLYKLMCVFEDELQKEKHRIGILTFSDVKHHTYRLLVNEDGSPTPIAQLYKEQFTDIFIDEYQDVDKMQDDIFKAISKPDNRFMVGDIKQSIYQFRGTEPQLFSNYRSSFPIYNRDGDNPSSDVSVFMSDNFRCDENIIEFCNIVCSKLLKTARSVGYTDNDDLIFKKKVPNGYTSPKVNVNLYHMPAKTQQFKAENPNFENMGSNQELEAEQIAEEIYRLIHDENELKADGSRIHPEDIVILVRKNKFVPIYTEALKKRGILSSSPDSRPYFENPDVLMVLSVLNAVDNPQRDAYLAGALHSPIFNFDIEELISIRMFGDSSQSLYTALCDYAKEKNDPLAEKCRDFINVLEGWQSDAAALSVDRFLRVLFDSERFIASGILAHTKDSGEGGNILLLYEFARSFENGTFKGLYQFIEYINSLIAKKKAFVDSEISSTANRVSIMTMHKSKGLEFPVCFISNCFTKFDTQEEEESFVCDYPTGVALMLSDSNGFSLVNTPMRDAILARIGRKSAEENMRVLYVAMTRARERLYISGATTHNVDNILNTARKRSMFFDRHISILPRNLMEWILIGCVDNPSKSFNLNILTVDPSIYIKDTARSASAEYLSDAALVDRLEKKLTFKYPYTELSKVPTKISVSRLYPDVLDSNDDSLELFSKEKTAAVPAFFSDIKEKTVKTSAAERGTATHLFLQFCDFEYASTHGIEAELARLDQKGFLPKNAASLIYVEELKSFLDSELMAKILSSSKRNIIREQRFNVRFSARGFTKADSKLSGCIAEETLAIQGVIDLILINNNGEIELYDYKTDRLSKEELDNYDIACSRMNIAHGQQLYYYSRAIRQLMGKPCSRVAVYSTHSAKLYDISTEDFALSDILPIDD